MPLTMATFSTESYQKYLQTSVIGRTIVYTDITGSTMDDARRLAHDVRTYPHGTIVMAERQTKARGSKDHKWDATNTGNIYASYILHLPPIFKSSEDSFYLEVVGCLAVLQAVRKYGVSQVIPKWPNDLWVRGHKLAGFLLEDGHLDIPGTTDCLYILGMGINVNADVRRSLDLHSIATSLICERGGDHVDREKFLADVCYSLENVLANKEEDNLRTFREENLFQPHSDIIVSNMSMQKVCDGKFVKICKNWDIKFIDTKTGQESRGHSEEYSIRPKVSKKIIVVSNSKPNNTKLGQSLPDWLTSITDTSKYVVCLLPESAIIVSDDWMGTCSLLVLAEEIDKSDLITAQVHQYLQRGGRVFSSGRAAMCIANLLDIPVEKGVLQLSLTSSKAVFQLQVEYFQNLKRPASEPCQDSSPPTSLSSPATITDKTQGLLLSSSLSLVQSILFHAEGDFFYVNERTFIPNQTEFGALTNTAECKPWVYSVRADDISENVIPLRAYVIDPTTQEKMFPLISGKVEGGGCFALIGFDIAASIVSSELPSTDQGNAVEQDKFKKDIFLQEVLQALLEI